MGTDEVSDCEVRLFDPSEQRWSDHFVVDVDTAEIGGLTAVGRVTVMYLDMNHPLQRTARHVWIRLGLFP